MAFPTIPTAGASRVLSVVTTTTAGGTVTSPNLSSLTKNSGDLLIAICIVYDGNSTNAEFSSWGGSFTEFVDQATTATMGIGAAYKWSDGTETGTFTVAVAGGAAGSDAAFFLLSIAGAHDTTPPEGGTIANGTAAEANPGSFNPAGWDAEDTLWIAVAGSGETSTTGAYTGIASAPANYTNYADSGISADAVGGVEGAVAFRQLNAASEDVGTFTLDLTNARNSALLIAVRPAAVVPLPDGAQQLPSSQQPWLRRAVNLDPQANRVLTTLAPPALGTVPFSTPVPAARQPSLRLSADATQNLLLTTLIEAGLTVGDSRIAAFQMQSPHARRYALDAMVSLLATTLASQEPPDTSLMGQAWM